MVREIGMKNYATTPSIGEFENLERFMQNSLPPVSPRPEFVHQLHHRLTDPMLPRVRFTQPVGIQYGLLIIASVISGIIFFITASQVIRALLKKNLGV
jgi:hypothetical protein